MLFLPDTNVISAYFQQRDAGLARKFSAAFPDLRLSILVLAELEYGAAKSGVARHRSRLDGLLANVAIEPFGAEDSRCYGELRADLERRGKIIGTMDTLIAAQALRLGATIVTHNLREFSRVSGLKIADWQSP
ncbi:MAG: VapC toxin family PIN domain ribonuclease [Opitutia bacterium]|nr:type II toxin-antitoxin system VapC family toxin [Opitutaceae bacterium]PHX85814.1 MAG: VapC toxin family PIN domain ribonuclease [Opitutae bacterium]